ncbi:hypothetical protein TUM4644_33340 [Shewanella colwelliana]|uniref:hypothetical protein n=1 Tax=Shewanella colwelliana TaxID=23 RepID=UPI001BBE04E3|nr:hypothetical protein [Shewanella colwelliana]GIU32918.1 hypothetical protein TUM4644_33340 [Shewanella colwelliana]
MFTTPDLASFIKKLGHTDLARTNLFLVRFGDFRSVISNDGIIDGFTDVISSEQGTSNLAPGFDGTSSMWKLAQRGALSTAYGALPPNAKQLLGATDELGVFQDLLGSGMNDLLDGNYRINNDFALMIKAVNLPERTIDTQTNKTDKRVFADVRGGGTGNVTMTCYCSPDYIERRLMMMWINAIHDEETQTYGFQSNYAREINVLMLDREGNTASAVALDGCFPIRVGQVQLDYDSNNTVATFEVEFFVSKQRQLNTLIHNKIKAL